ncbi:MAG: hypothetical protein J6Q24_02605 [Clostridia bacterium]|nr:hypothetical protein [Clostridia bacterium]
MNKKRWILVIIVVGVVVFASLLFALVKRPIMSIGVDKVIIKTYSHSNTPGITEVELEPGEAGKAILLYNLGGVGFNINASLAVLLIGLRFIIITENISRSLKVLPIL